MTMHEKSKSITWDEWETIIHVAEAIVMEYPEQLDEFLTILAELRDQYLESREMQGAEI